MKKRVGKVKRFIAVLMVGITLSSSVFYSYSIPAQASTIVPAAQTIIDALMTLFGYSLGFGKSADEMSSVLTPDVFSSAIDSSFNGGGIELGSYGTVDFSDETAVFEFLKKAYQLTTATVAGEAYDKLLSGYDYVSYKTSGVSSTKTMNDYLGDIISKYETDGTSALKEDMQQAFTVISGGASSGDDNDEDPDFTPLSWRIAAGLMAGFTAFGALPFLEDGTEDETALAVPALSQFNNFIGESGFCICMDYASYVSHFEFAPSRFGLAGDIGGMYYYYCLFTSSTGVDWNVSFCSSSPLVAYFCENAGSVSCYLAPKTIDAELYIQSNYTNSLGSRLANTTSDIPFEPYYKINKFNDSLSSIVTNFPVVESLDDAISFIESNDIVVNTTTRQFYETTPTSTVPEYVVNFMTRTPSTTDLTGLAAALADLSTDTAGTADYIPSVESVVQTATEALPEPAPAPDEVPDESIEQEQDPETGQFNYFNILQLILNAIKAIAASVWAFFQNPMAGILSGIHSLIELVPGCFELVRGWIELLPGSIFQFFEAPLLAIQSALDGLNPFESWWPRLQPYLDKFLEIFQSSTVEPDSTDPDIPSEDEGGDGRHSFDLLSLLNGLWLLIMILIMLLSIFLHLMIFIINIFKIPASTGYLNAHMVSGLNYIKTLEITGIGLSVYDFMMGLVYILMVFGVVKVLRANIHHIKIPKSMRGGLFS